MSLACQVDSYKTQFQSKVKSCQPATNDATSNGKKNKLKGYEIILEDTILFPEGGGQPDDRGKLNEVDVLRVTRRGSDAVHFTLQPLEPGTEVAITVDWSRRWDHMQQHSGQHLITAIADQMYNYPTTSWSLGEKVSFIELDTPDMTAEEMQTVESATNEKIRQGLRMYPTLYNGIDDPALKEVRTRGLPDDHVGVVRVVTIESIENNMCCGTHVSNLAHLQAVKLLGVEKGKKGKVNLNFLVGDRVLNYLQKCYTTEKAMTGLLKCNPNQHVELVDKLQKSLKISNKNSLMLLRDVAVMEAERFKLNRQPLLVLHRKEGDNEFMNMVVNEIADETVLMLLTVGDEKGAGMFLLAGPEAAIKQLGPRGAELLDGKGGGKKGRFQGKANRLSKIPEVQTLLQEYLQGQKES